MSSSLVTAKFRRSRAQGMVDYFTQDDAPPLPRRVWEDVYYVATQLQRALHPMVRKPPSAVGLLQTARRATKLVTKREETSAIWEACWRRCGGLCECGCGGDVRRAEEDSPINHWPHIATLDHFRGRARVRQSVENCWILRADCHREKTRESPDKATWLRRFIVHAERHGYTYWAEEARKVLEGSVAVKADERRRRSIR